MIKSIQVQTTKLSGAGVEVVPQSSSSRTHWSLYLRDDKGECEWVEDMPITNNPTRALELALMKAAKLSMEHNAPIEPIK